MMENVYVIKVKTKPPLSSLYPSERRYSASTVGGLSFVHFGLGALSLLLGTLALSLQGPILSVACLVPFVTGLLAWRRWYIDRNISIFFYGNLFSLLAAILCFVATVFDIAAATDNTRGSLWSLEKILEHPRDYSYLEERARRNSSTSEWTLSKENAFNVHEDYDLASVSDSITPTPGIVMDKMSNISGYILTSSIGTSTEEDDSKDYRAFADNDLKEQETSLYEKKVPLFEEGLEGESNVTQESLEMIKTKVMSFWQKNYHDTSQTKLLLTVNVLVASLLEIFWSALSAKIALRGMMNRLPESSYANNSAAGAKGETTAATKRKSPAPRPDILDHDRRLSESLQDLNALHNVRSSGPRLPLPESSREFRERVERFLANQAAHRIVEGSCT